jgi:hypothetical protein
MYSMYYIKIWKTLKIFFEVLTLIFLSVVTRNGVVVLGQIDSCLVLQKSSLYVRVLFYFTKMLVVQHSVQFGPIINLERSCQ